MTDRKTILLLLIVAVLLEVLLIRGSGLMEWVAGGPHSMEEIRGLVTDWRVLTSVVLVSVVTLLAVKWIQLGTAGRRSGVGE